MKISFFLIPFFCFSPETLIWKWHDENYNLWILTSSKLHNKRFWNIPIQHTLCGTISQIICILVSELKWFVKQNTHLEAWFLMPFFHSVDSTFSVLAFVSLRMKCAHEKCIAVICICRSLWLGCCCLLFCGKGLKAISQSDEWILISPFWQMHFISTAAQKRLSDLE